TGVTSKSVFPILTFLLISYRPFITFQSLFQLISLYPLHLTLKTNQDQIEILFHFSIEERVTNSLYNNLLFYRTLSSLGVSTKTDKLKGDRHLLKHTFFNVVSLF